MHFHTLTKTILLILSYATLLANCASVPETAGTNPEDPYERWNRQVYSFNTALDTYLLKPVAVGYKEYVPQTAQTGVNNFFSNLSDVKNALNGILQLDGEKTLTSITRFLLNTTFGFFGLFDIATASGLKQTSTSLSMTLHEYGVGAGPYLVLPFFGPSDVRSGVALAPETVYLDPRGSQSIAISSQWLDDNSTPLSILNIIKLRASFLRAEEVLIGDKYSFTRDAYLQRRQFQEQGGTVTHDAFSDDVEVGDGEEIEEESLESF